jgi:predicted nuclease of predicted toxin-antitoxin system
MKLLFDQNISHGIIDLMRVNNRHANHGKDFDLQFATDHRIWHFAKEQDVHIVTFDADF